MDFVSSPHFSIEHLLLNIDSFDMTDIPSGNALPKTSQPKIAYSSVVMQLILIAVEQHKDLILESTILSILLGN